jgi:hypothetical protein
MFIELAPFILRCVLNVLREPLAELVVRIKEAWHDEMQQSPQLYTAASINREVQIVEKSRTLHGILDRCACQKQAIPTVKAEQGLPANASSVLDILGFVEYHVLPLDPLKVLLVLGNLQSSQHAS